MNLCLASLCAVVALPALSACAEKSAAADPVLRGFGTPGVSAYLGDEQVSSLQALLDRCQAVSQGSAPSSDSKGLAASCAQLHRTMHNQPGNMVQTGATP